MAGFSAAMANAVPLVRYASRGPTAPTEHFESVTPRGSHSAASPFCHPSQAKAAAAATLQRSNDEDGVAEALERFILGR